MTAPNKPTIIPVKTHKVKLLEVNQETTNVRSFRFSYPHGFDYKPGQFIMINLDVIQDGISKFIKRSYSLSSAPMQEKHIETIVKLMGAGSKRLFEHMKGDELEIAGPYGMFTFQEEVSNEVHGRKLNHIVLLAAGSGITAPLSIARYILDSSLALKVSFIFSNKTSHDIIARKELEKMTAEHDNFSLYLTVTRPEEDPDWHGLTGRVDEKLIKAAVHDVSDALFYLCGPAEFVDHCAKLLSSLGVDTKQIKTEKYE
ncbi:TPA: hypothetical protein HA246_00030 [Candidatus Woesearchaeota archaeon]|nr:hypothetical protein [Candidatus Woesearchaeota archaeon]